MGTRRLTRKSIIGFAALIMCDLAHADSVFTGVGVFLENAGNGEGSPGIHVNTNVAPLSPATSVDSVILERKVTDGTGPWTQPLTYGGGDSWGEWDYNPGNPISRAEPLIFGLTATDNLGVKTVADDIIIPAGYDLDPIQNLTITPGTSGYDVSFDPIAGAENYSFWVWGLAGVPAGYATNFGGGANISDLPVIPYALLIPGEAYGVTVFAQRTFNYTWGDNDLTGQYRRYISTNLIAETPTSAPLPSSAIGSIALLGLFASARLRKTSKMCIHE